MGGDYSATATALSLMPKIYIDSLAAGLDPKESVNVSTTSGDGNIDLTGGTFVSGSTLDSVIVDDVWRVLVKNQTDASENGIYVYSASTSGFTRSDDFDGTPSNEVSTGAFTTVVTGATIFNTQWVVVSKDPIVVGTDDINWSILNGANNHIGGVGITITGNTIMFDGGGVAGDSMTWSGTQLDIDPTSGGLLTALDLKLDIVDFNTYTGSTDTILTGLRTDIDIVSGQTDTNASDIIALSSISVTGGTNIGGASEIYTTVTDNKLNLRTISGTSNVTVSQSGNFILISGTTVDGEKITKSINQSSHGFVLLDVVAYSGSSYYKPLSTSVGGEPLGIISDVEDTDNFTITYQGYISGISGVTDADSNSISGETVYYLSPVVAGKLTSIVTTTEDDVVKPMLITLTSDNANVVNYRGDIVLADPEGHFVINVGTGTGEVYSGTTGTTDIFRTIAGRINTTVTTSGDTIVIDGNTNENVGTGVGEVYSGSTGTTEFFRKIKSGIASTVSVSGSDIIIDVNTGETKTLGIYEYSGATYVITTSDEFVGVSGLSTTFLPATPINGKPIIISDVNGDALANNITIDGNGNNVDGAATAVINTDYGSMTLMFTGSIWKVIAFA